MFGKASLLAGVLSLGLVVQSSSASAAIPKQDLNEYLSSIGWTKKDLRQYANYYEIPWKDFNNIEDLKEALGTVINQENMTAMLEKYMMKRPQLDELMDHFGDSVDNYTFIEDLDNSVEFYIEAGQEMAETENELAELGITEEETEKLFNYLAQVEENNPSVLDQMNIISSRMEEFSYIEDPSQLSEADMNEIIQTMEQVADIYDIKTSFSIGTKKVTLNELLAMKEAPKENLSGVIYGLNDEVLMDFSIPPKYFSTGLIIDQGGSMVDVGEIANDYCDHMHDEKKEDILSKRYK